MDPVAIAVLVRNDVETYDYDAIYAASPNLTGMPAKAEWVASQLAALREALVEPYWMDVDVHDDHRAPSRNEQCLIVADDREGYLLAYVPSGDKYTLVKRRSAGGFGSFGVDGDAVGVFMAR